MPRGSPSKKAASGGGRLARARGGAQKAVRSASTTGASNGSAAGNTNADDIKRIEVSSSGTFGIIFLLLTIGASLATSYILTQNPGCMSSGGESGTSSGTPASTSNLRSSPAATTSTALATPAAAPAAGGTREGFPPACTAEQKASVLKQLTADKCFDQPYTQQCSFVTATKRGTCPEDNHWVRQVYSQFVAPDNTFTAIFTSCGRNEKEMDVLQIGSHDTAKYSKQKWMGAIQNDCRKPVSPSSQTQSAKMLCINQDSNKLTEIRSARSAAGISSDEIKDVQASLGAVESFGLKTLDKVVEESGWKGKPIHYLKIAGSDPDVIRGATETLDQVRYLEFEYHYQGAWANGSMSDLVKRRLLDKNFVCYWDGGQNGLWRMTDCWHAHYAQKWWADVACVSTVHEESKEILKAMEQYFMETLQKTQSF